MDNVYDFWERLVQVVLREERLRRNALRDFSTTTDDSSSTSTEPMSNFLPSERFREMGEFMGRGSFGSVYEGFGRFNGSSTEPMSNIFSSGRFERIKTSLENIECGYELELHSTSSLSPENSLLLSSSKEVGFQRTGSLDIYPLDEQTSFRFEGTEGEFEFFCKGLGFSGIEDFGIPTEEWEAMKVRSSSNFVLATKSLPIDLPAIRVNNVVLSGNECAKVISCNGIKGARSPALAPPPAMSLPVIDSSCSTWDILKAFAPENDRILSRFEVCEAVNSDDEDQRNRDEEEDGVHRVVMKPMPNISPSGRFRRIITSWEKGELLGRGSFGSVYEGIASDGFFFAVKEVSLLDQGEDGRQSLYRLEQEIALLSQFEHENIVQYYGTDKDESKLYIFLELVTKGSLMRLYQKYHLRDSQVSNYTRQILHGLMYLHDRDVVHRDIKCANILVDANGSVKLADFGLAKAAKLNDVKSCKGTAFWMAPEVVNRRNQGYGRAADIWSLGCTVLEMLTRQFPYSHSEYMQALFRIGKGELPQVPESLSQDARDFILQCLQVNPNSRPSAAQLLNHPFMKYSLTQSGSASPYHPFRESTPFASPLWVLAVE